MNKTIVKADELFDAGYYCAETVLLTIADEQGIKSELIPAIATGLCSGIARTSQMCGALSGGILALNLVYGRRSVHDSVSQNYAVVQKLLKGFEEKFGSQNCGELLGCDLATRKGQKEFLERELYRDCQRYSREAAALVRIIIDQEPVKKHAPESSTNSCKPGEDAGNGCRAPVEPKG